DDAMLSVGEGAQGNAEFGHYDAGKLGQAGAPAQQQPHAESKAHQETPVPENNEVAAAPKADESHDPKVHTLPIAEHVEGGDVDKPEPVKAPPKAAAPPPAKDKGKGGNHYIEGNLEAVRAGLYGKDGKDGIISTDKLHRNWFVKQKGTKELKEFQLTDEQ